jgi:hypothetical protein
VLKWEEERIGIVLDEQYQRRFSVERTRFTREDKGNNRKGDTESVVLDEHATPRHPQKLFLLQSNTKL